MGNPWDVKATEWLGKALPNEVTKLNSYSKYIQYIPYVGPALSTIMKGMSAVDAGATAYADTYKEDKRTNDSSSSRRVVGASRAIPAIISGVKGKSQDPGIYGSPGGNINRDWANVAGQIGNYLPGISMGESGSSGEGGGGMSIDTSSIGLGSVASAVKNPYFNKGEKKRIESASDSNTAASNNKLFDMFTNNKTTNQLSGDAASKLMGILSTKKMLADMFNNDGALVEDKDKDQKIYSKLFNEVFGRKLDNIIGRPAMQGMAIPTAGSQLQNI